MSGLFWWPPDGAAAQLAGASTDGAASITLGAVTLAATGKVDVAGAASITLAGVGLTATGKVDVKGNASITLAGISLTATGQAGSVTGTAAITLDGLTLGASGKVEARGTASITLDGLTLGAVGDVDVQGAALITLDSVAVSAAGEVLASGTASITLDGIGLVAEGSTASSVTGSAAITLSGLTLTASGYRVGNAFAFVRQVDRLLELRIARGCDVQQIDRLFALPGIDRAAYAGATGAAMPAIRIFTQNEGEVIQYQLDWEVALNGASISTSSWTSSPAGLTVSSTNASPLILVTVSGGSAGTLYTLTNTITTSSSETLVRSINIAFEEP